METCLHHWYLSRPFRRDGHRIIHHRCLLCGGEKDLIEVFRKVKIASQTTVGEIYKKYYTDVTYPEKEVKNMGVITSENAAERRQKGKENEARREEIVDAFISAGGNERHGSIKFAASLLDIPETTVRGLLKKWGYYTPKKKGKKKPKADSATTILHEWPENDPPGGVLPPVIPPKSIEEHLGPIKEVPAMVPVEVVEKLIEFSREEGKIFWEGYKLGRGLE